MAKLYKIKFRYLLKVVKNGRQIFDILYANHAILVTKTRSFVTLQLLYGEKYAFVKNRTEYHIILVDDGQFLKVKQMGGHGGQVLLILLKT